MSSNSQEKSSVLTRSSIEMQSKFNPSTLPLQSSSASSNDRDALIDKYQEKMGDMLELQNQLCKTKNRLTSVMEESRKNNLQYSQFLQEKEIRLEEASKQIHELENEVKTRIQNEIDNSNKAAAIEIKCKHYEELLNQANAELQEQKKQLQLQLSEKKETDKMSQNQIQEIQARLEEKNNQISDMRVKLSELKQQNLTCTESLMHQEQELREIADLKEQLKSQNSKLQESREKLKMQLKQSSDESSIQLVTINDQQNCIMKLRKDKAKYKQNCQDLEKIVNDLKYQLEQYSEYPKKIEEMENEITKYKKLYEKETKKTNNATTLLSMISSLVGNVCKPKEIINNIQEICKERDDLKQEIQRAEVKCQGVQEITLENEQLKQTISNLEAQLAAFQLKNKFHKSIENARNEQHQQILDYASEFGYVSNPQPTLRSVIISVIIGKRIHKLIQENDSVLFLHDNRDWYWISTQQTRHIKSIFHESSELLKKYQNERDEINQQNESIRDQLAQISKESENKTLSNEKKEKSLLFLRNEIMRLNNELSSLIDPESYSQLHENYVNIKKQFKALKKQQQQTEREKHEMQHEIEELNISSQYQTQEIAVLHEELEVAEKNNDKLKEYIRILEKSQMSKNRELLSLERGIQKVKTINDKNTAQCDALAIENQNLFTQLHKSKLITSQDVQAHSAQLGLKATRTLL